MLLAYHAVDLGRHDRAFVQASPGTAETPPALERWILEQAADGRVGIDSGFNLSINRRVDDVGFFDSISLAGTYRGLLALSDMPATKATQGLDGWELGLRALRACGVRALVTMHERPDCTLVNQRDLLRLYSIVDPAPRVATCAWDSAVFIPDADMDRALRDPSIDPARKLILPESARSATALESVRNAAPARVTYRRTGPDRFEIAVDSGAPCWVRVLESFDTGWRATLDGQDAPIFPAHGMAIAIPVPAGKHALALEFFTPGRIEGAWISAAAALLLTGVVALAWRRAW